MAKRARNGSKKSSSPVSWLKMRISTDSHRTTKAWQEDKSRTNQLRFPKQHFPKALQILCSLLSSFFKKKHSTVIHTCARSTGNSNAVCKLSYHPVTYYIFTGISLCFGYFITHRLVFISSPPRHPLLTLHPIMVAWPRTFFSVPAAAHAPPCLPISYVAYWGLGFAPP